MKNFKLYLVILSILLSSNSIFGMEQKPNNLKKYIDTNFIVRAIDLTPESLDKMSNEEFAFKLFMYIVNINNIAVPINISKEEVAEFFDLNSFKNGILNILETSLDDETKKQLIVKYLVDNIKEDKFLSLIHKYGVNNRKIVLINKEQLATAILNSMNKEKFNSKDYNNLVNTAQVKKLLGLSEKSSEIDALEKLTDPSLLYRVEGGIIGTGLLSSHLFLISLYSLLYQNHTFNNITSIVIIGVLFFYMYTMKKIYDAHEANKLRKLTIAKTLSKIPPILIKNIDNLPTINNIFNTDFTDKSKLDYKSIKYYKYAILKFLARYAQQIVEDKDSSLKFFILSSFSSFLESIDIKLLTDKETIRKIELLKVDLKDIDKICKDGIVSDLVKKITEFIRDQMPVFIETKYLNKYLVNPDMLILIITKILNDKKLDLNQVKNIFNLDEIEKLLDITKEELDIIFFSNNIELSRIQKIIATLSSQNQRRLEGSAAFSSVIVAERILGLSINPSISVGIEGFLSISSLLAGALYYLNNLKNPSLYNIIRSNIIKNRIKNRLYNYFIKPDNKFSYDLFYDSLTGNQRNMINETILANAEIDPAVLLTEITFLETLDIKQLEFLENMFKMYGYKKSENLATFMETLTDDQIKKVMADKDNRYKYLFCEYNLDLLFNLFDEKNSFYQSLTDDQKSKVSDVLQRLTEELLPELLPE